VLMDVRVPCRVHVGLGGQMFDTQDWTTVADKREDRQEYSDILDEDTGFSEVRKYSSFSCSSTRPFLLMMQARRASMTKSGETCAGDRAPGKPGE
jgi:hypothetical protein